MQINDNIKLIRELSGKTQAEFAELIKTNVSNLKTYENTNVKPKAYLILNISRYAGISSDDLENVKLSPEDIKIEDDKDEKVNGSKKPSADYLAGQLAMAERLIAKLEEDHVEAKADKNKLFKALEDAQKTIIDVLKPIKEQTQEILINSREVKDNMIDGLIEMQSEHRALMDGMDQVLKLPPGTTYGKADILEEASQELLKKDRIKKSAHKQSKAG